MAQPHALAHQPDAAGITASPPWRALEASAPVTRRAHRLARQGDTGTALRLLAWLLVDLDPVTAPPDLRLIRLAHTFIRIDAIIDAGSRTAADDEFVLSWSLYAYRAAERRHGTTSDLWCESADWHAHVLTAQGLTGDAVTVRRRQLTAVRDDRPAVQHRARRRLAQALHADGQCAAAYDQLRDCLQPAAGTALDDHLELMASLRCWLMLLAGCHQLTELHRYERLLRGLPEQARRVGAEAIIAGASNDRHPPICQLRPAAPPSDDPGDATAAVISWVETMATTSRDSGTRRTAATPVPTSGRSRAATATGAEPA